MPTFGDERDPDDNIEDDGSEANVFGLQAGDGGDR
jgi:hypothetical protein